MVFLIAKVFWLLLYIPWRCWYFKYGNWNRYAFSPKLVEECVNTFNRFVRRISGSDFITISGRGDRVFWWYVFNSLLKYVYRALKKSARIDEADADKAMRFFVYMVPHISMFAPSIRRSLGELRWDDYDGFSERSLDWFNECRGDVFTPEFVFFIQSALKYVTPSSIRAMEVSFAYAKERINDKLVLAPCMRAVVEALLDVCENLIGIAKDAPVTLCDGMMAYADNLAHTARDFYDLDLANVAIENWQHMNQVRYRISHHCYTMTCDARLHDYFEGMHTVGIAIYNQLNATPRLPAPAIELPPTPEDMPVLARVADLTRRIEVLEAKGAKAKERTSEFNQKVKQAIKSAAEQANPSKPKESHRKYRRAATEEWSKKQAAEMAGVTTRQMTNWDRKPPDPDYPGWEDPLSFAKWINKRKDKALMAIKLKNSVRYKETATERSMKK